MRNTKDGKISIIIERLEAGGTSHTPAPRVFIARYFMDERWLSALTGLLTGMSNPEFDAMVYQLQRFKDTVELVT